MSVGWAEDQVRIQLIQVSDGRAVDHALSSGRHANVCKSVLPYYEGAKASKDKIINKPLTLPTDGKADVVVSILADRDGYEICFVEDIVYWVNLALLPSCHHALLPSSHARARARA